MTAIRYSWLPADVPGLGRVDFAARIETTAGETSVAIEDIVVALPRDAGASSDLDPFELGFRSRGGWMSVADYLREVALDTIATEPR